jgi:hypothetical protein
MQATFTSSNFAGRKSLGERRGRNLAEQKTGSKAAAQTRIALPTVQTACRLVADSVAKVANGRRERTLAGWRVHWRWHPDAYLFTALCTHAKTGTALGGE